MTPRDFSHLRHFPGTDSSRYSSVVRAADWVNRLPWSLLAAWLFLLALIPTRLDLPQAALLWLFFLTDWLLLALLQRARKSFGPPQSPTLLLACLRLLPAALPTPWNLAAQCAGTVLVVYAFWIEPHHIHVTRQSLASPKWRTGTPPLRVLHVGDLHVERITGRERQLVELAHALHPDLILCSGDFLSLSNVRDPEAWRDARAVLSRLSAPLGVFTVSGSPPVDVPEVVARLLDGLNIRWLRDEKITLGHCGQAVDIVGLNCTHRPSIDRAALARLLPDGCPNLTILLYHTPDLAPEAAPHGIDLQLSGHTHGGQVRLPFLGALYTASLYYKRYESGRRAVGGMTLYVTRGIGMEGKGAPRVRFLCPPEIILWEIGPEENT